MHGYRGPTHRMEYFTNASTKGKVRYGKFPFAISVLESPGNHLPIGMAFSATVTDAGLAVWRLTVRGAKVPGRFVVIDGEFVQLMDAAERPSCSQTQTAGNEVARAVCCLW
jgi:hypothetical protein